MHCGVYRMDGSGRVAAGSRRAWRDYHLGQTLKTDDGFVLIDFEGEPARPLAERRLKHWALKDVAGMSRSSMRVRRPTGRTRMRPTKALSAQILRDAFLDGYLSSAARHGAVFLPRNRGAVDPWLDFF